MGWLERIPQLSPVAAARQADRGAIALALAEPRALIDLVLRGECSGESVRVGP